MQPHVQDAWSHKKLGEEQTPSPGALRGSTALGHHDFGLSVARTEPVKSVVLSPVCGTVTAAPSHSRPSLALSPSTTPAAFNKGEAMTNPICREKMAAQAVWPQGHNLYSQHSGTVDPPADKASTLWAAGPRAHVQDSPGASSPAGGSHRHHGHSPGPAHATPACH